MKKLILAVGVATVASLGAFTVPTVAQAHRLVTQRRGRGRADAGYRRRLVVVARGSGPGRDPGHSGNRRFRSLQRAGSERDGREQPG